jgi:hypothetical protein
MKNLERGKDYEAWKKHFGPLAEAWEEQEEAEKEKTGEGKEGFEVYWKNVEIRPEKPLTFEMEVEKIPLEIAKGETVMFIEIDLEETDDLVRKARDLQKEPEDKRIKEVVKLVRETIKYPYQETLEEIQKTDEKEADWIKENACGDVTGNVKLSEIVEHGYGACRQYSILFALLAQEAGLRGTTEFSSTWKKMNNIIRPDTKEKLFKTVPLGEIDPPHAWNEVQLSDGRWIPVDATANLIGIDSNSLEIFQRARYESSRNFEINNLPAGLAYSPSISFKPGQGTVKQEKTIKLSKRLDLETKEETLILPEFKGDLDFQFIDYHMKALGGLRVLGVRLKE